MPNALVRIYIQSGLVQEVVGPDGITVRVIDLDTEGAPISDLKALNQGDRRNLPEDCRDRTHGYIRNW
jgi:hypothetical protein